MSSRARSASSPASCRSAGAVAATAGVHRSPAASPATGRSTKADRGASGRHDRRRISVFASMSSRIAPRRGSTSSISPGPSRPRRTVSAAAIGIAPASDAAATSLSRVTRERERTEAVPVDHRPDPAPVAEHERGGAVPRREEPGGPAGERTGQRVAGGSERRRFRDEREERRLEAPAGDREQLERLVERQRVRAVGRDERTGLDQPTGRRSGAAERIGGAPVDLGAVRPDRVDLAVVGDRPERLGEPPFGMRVRRVALVEDRVADRQPRGEVRIQVREAPAGDQALVDDRSARRRRNGERGELRAGMSRRVLHPAPGEDEAELEPGIGQPARPFDDGLREGRPGRGRLPAERRWDRPEPSARSGSAAAPRPGQPRRSDAPPPRPRPAVGGTARRSPDDRRDRAPDGRRRSARAGAAPRHRRSRRRRRRMRPGGRASRARRGQAGGLAGATGRPRPRRTRHRTRRARSVGRTAGWAGGRA